MNTKRKPIIQIVLKSIILALLFSTCNIGLENNTEDPSPLNSPKELTAFSFTAADNAVLDSDVTGTIDGTNITATVPYGTDATTLVATFSTTGSNVSVGSTSQTSGTTPNDFSSAVTYTVTAEDSSKQNYTVSVTIAGTLNGSNANYTIGGVVMNMQYCPGGTFPTGDDDSVSETINDAFWIGETEVTYQLWYTVYTWATTGTGGATGEGAYTFANTGIPGHDGIAGNEIDSQEPVTTINWRDAIVFCNALTEYFNANNSGDFNCVYTADSSYTTPIRTATNSETITNTTDGSQDAPYVNPDATGFRLPEKYEWECAARYIDGSNWTPGNYASGATADYSDTTTTENVAVFGSYSGSSNSTAAVKSKAANALGCYDMSGNVLEWNFDRNSNTSNRANRGGNWFYSAYMLQVGFLYYSIPYDVYEGFGFRLCRTAN